MAAKAELELREALLTTGILHPVQVESRSNTHVGAVCRLLKGQDRTWLKAVEYLLTLAAENQVPLHLGTRFLLKEGKLVKGWDIVVEAKTASELRRALEMLKAGAASVADMEPEELEPPAVASHTHSPPPAEPAPAPKAQIDPEELEKRAAAYASRTSASPRASGTAGDVPPPPVADTRPRVVFRGTAKDQKNRTVPVIVEEVVLPHYYPDDMNKPDDKDKGAKTL